MRHAVACALLALLAGCASPPDPPPDDFFEPVRPIDIPAYLAEKSGSNVLWHVRVDNAGSLTQHDLELRLAVRHATLASTQVQEDTAETRIGTLEGRTSATFTLTTAYHGYGDYSGPVEVWQKGARVARSAVFFEECPGAC